jgi:hypothetical protein
LAGPDVASITRSLMMECADSTRLLELYYWSQEEGLPETIRGIMAMPQESRTMLRAFLAMASQHALVSGTIDRLGRLILSSPQTTETLQATAEACRRNKMPDAA